MRVLEKPTLAVTHNHTARTTTVVRELRGVAIATVVTLPGILTRRKAIDAAGLSPKEMASPAFSLAFLPTQRPKAA